MLWLHRSSSPAKLLTDISRMFIFSPFPTAYLCLLTQVNWRGKHLWEAWDGERGNPGHRGEPG